MARPKVHHKDRKNTGLKLDEDVHQALREHNEATGIPMNRTIQEGTKRLLMEQGFFPPGSNGAGQVTSIAPARAVLRKTS